MNKIISFKEFLNESIEGTAEINEGISTANELASFISKEEKHFAAFLKPKKINAVVNGDIVTIKPGSGSFTITVDYQNSTISSTGKPEWPESTSYVELMEYIKHTKFKINESKTITITEGVEEQIKKEVISKLSDFFGCAPGNLSKFNFDGKDNIKELTKALRSTSDEGTAQYYRIAIIMAKRDLGIHESEEVNEGKKEDLAVQLDAIFTQIKGMNLDKNAEFLFTKTGIAFGFLDMLSKPGAIKNLQDKSPESKKRIKDAHAALDAAKSTEEIKSILVNLVDTISESIVNEKLDTKYWIGYNDAQGPKWQSEKSTDFEDTFNTAVDGWNDEAEGPENKIKGAQIKNIKKLAEEFFKKEKFITFNIIQAMIMQES